MTPQRASGPSCHHIEEQRLHKLGSPRCVLVAISLNVLLSPGWVSQADAWSVGPPDERAGDPPLHYECTSCHGSYPRNSGGGFLSVLGLPETYTSDTDYVLTISLTDTGQARWGFEMTVISQRDGTKAGDLARLDGMTQVSEGEGGKRSVEAIILTHADFLNYESLKRHLQA